MLIVTIAATVEPVTATEAKAHLRVTHTSDDTLIASLITAAREAIEQRTGRALAGASYRWASEDEVMADMRLPLWPVSAVSEVSYEDSEGARQVMDSGDYALDGDRALVSIDPLPDFAEKLSVTFSVAPTNVPVALKQAILLVVGDLYANTEATGEQVADNPTVERLCTPYRVSFGL